MYLSTSTSTEDFPEMYLSTFQVLYKLYSCPALVGGGGGVEAGGVLPGRGGGGGGKPGQRWMDCVARNERAVGVTGMKSMTELAVQRRIASVAVTQ